jgi:hypothetical protein
MTANKSALPDELACCAQVLLEGASCLDVGMSSKPGMPRAGARALWLHAGRCADQNNDREQRRQVETGSTVKARRMFRRRYVGKTGLSVSDENPRAWGNLSRGSAKQCSALDSVTKRSPEHKTR